MDQEFSKYPEHTLLAQIGADIYAHSGEVTILYDRTLTQELLSLDYDVGERELYFKFTEGHVPFGEKLIPEISSVLETVEKVVLIQIDIETNEAVFGLEVPVTLVE